MAVRGASGGRAAWARPPHSLAQVKALLAEFDEQQLASTLAFARAIAKAPEDEVAAQRIAAALAMLQAEVRPHPQDPQQLLVEAGPTASRVQRRAYRLRVAILGLKPPIMRRLLLPGDLGLAGLHQALRLAFGWPVDGPYRFLIDGAPYGEGLTDPDEPLLDPQRTALDDLLLEPGQVWRHVSPMAGGGWALQLRVTEVLPAEACVGRPALEGGQRTAPPWRAAGPEAFVRYLQAHESPRHPAHAWAQGISTEPYPIRVAWGPLQRALRDADWAQHRRPAPAREADPIHALLRGPQR